MTCPTVSWSPKGMLSVTNGRRSALTRSINASASGIVNFHSGLVSPGWIWRATASIVRRPRLSTLSRSVSSAGRTSAAIASTAAQAACSRFVQLESGASGSASSISTGSVPGGKALRSANAWTT